VLSGLVWSCLWYGLVSGMVWYPRSPLPTITIYIFFILFYIYIYILIITYGKPFLSICF
jgi:hypothetical protein